MFQILGVNAKNPVKFIATKNMGPDFPQKVAVWKGNPEMGPLVSGTSRLVKYSSLARIEYVLGKL